MRSLDLSEIQQVSAGQRLPPLFATGIASSVTHPLNNALAGKNISTATLLHAAIANLAAAPLIAHAPATPGCPLEAVTIMIYLAGLRSYVQASLTHGACELRDQPDLVY